MSRSPVKAILLALILLLALTSLACFAFPLCVIWPFRHQAQGELSIALFVKQIGPWVSAVCAVACLVALVALWRRARWTSRSAAVLATALACVGVLLSSFNIYEQMFHPVDAPQFEAAQTAKLDPDDMVIAVTANRISRAYPIREMAYHHVVNDTVGREPVVATY